MTQISRPLQIALAAIVLFAAVWFVALRGHSSGGESSPAPASSSAQPASPGPASPSSSGAGSSGSSGSSGSAGSSPSSGSTYHGSAPGVAGLTRAIAKARGAVAQSQKQAAAQSGAKHPSSSSTHAATAGSHAGSSAGAKAAAPSAGAKGSSGKAAPSASSTTQTADIPAKQAIVQSELKHGRTVVILFWNPKGSDDVAVHVELRLLQIVGKRLLPEDRKLAVHYAHAGEVGQFGSITHSLQVLQTPTTLVISPSGDAKTLTGLVDAYTIQQAIREARHPSRHP